MESDVRVSVIVVAKAGKKSKTSLCERRTVKIM